MLATHEESCDHLEVILKTVERCNLNCSYCYFFHGGDETYKKNPPFISKDTLSDVASFLAKGSSELSIKKIRLNLHGGEPMLQKLHDFDDMCLLFRQVLGPIVELELVIQTNGTIFSDEWVKLLIKHNVSIGISCDGTEEYHNKFRLDHKGHGSHHVVKENIRKFNIAFKELNVKPVGLLCVIDPSRDPRKIYQHFTRELQVHSIDFLLPDYTHDTFNEDPVLYGKFLCNLFDVWAEDDNPSISIRILERAMKHLTMDMIQIDYMQIQETKYREFTISSSGKLGSIDVLRSASSEWMWEGDDVKSVSLSGYLKGPLLTRLRSALQVLPTSCQNCCWKKLCRGGYMINRYSKETHFDNPTVYCNALKLFYTHVSRYLLQHGYPIERLENFLCSDSSLSFNGALAVH